MHGGDSVSTVANRHNTDGRIQAVIDDDEYCKYWTATFQQLAVVSDRNTVSYTLAAVDCRCPPPTV